MSGDTGGLAGITGEQYRSSSDPLRQNLSMNSSARLSTSTSTAPGLGSLEWTAQSGVLLAVWKLGDPAVHASSSSSVQSSRLGGGRLGVVAGVVVVGDGWRRAMALAARTVLSSVRRRSVPLPSSSMDVVMV